MLFRSYMFLEFCKLEVEEIHGGKVHSAHARRRGNLPNPGLSLATHQCSKKCRIRMSSPIGRYVVMIRRKNAGWIESTENVHKNQPGVDLILESKRRSNSRLLTAN